MKKRVNWTIEKDCISLLKQSKKINPKDISLSELVEYAIRNTYLNKEEAIREKMKANKREFMKLQDQLKEMEDKNDR